MEGQKWRQMELSMGIQKLKRAPANFDKSFRKEKCIRLSYIENPYFPSKWFAHYTTGRKISSKSNYSLNHPSPSTFTPPYSDQLYHQTKPLYVILRRKKITQKRLTSHFVIPYSLHFYKTINESKQNTVRHSFTQTAGNYTEYRPHSQITHCAIPNQRNAPNR